MPRVRLQHVGLIGVALVLALALNITGLAQTATPTLAEEPTAVETEAPTAVPTEAVDPTATESADSEADAEPTAADEATGETTDESAAKETPAVEAAADEGETPVADDAAADEETASTPPPEPEAADATATPEPELIAEPEATPEPMRLTVYNQNMALVKEVRAFDLVEGINAVQYGDVPLDIQPDSVHLVSLTDPDGIRVLEQSYAYDRVDSDFLLRAYVDQEISLVTRQGSVYTGTLISGVEDIVLDTEEGVKVIALAQVQEFSFPPLPEDLVRTPTIEWLLEADKGGEHLMRVMYLTYGLDWRANYAAVLSADEKAASLVGWVLLENQSGTSYNDVKLKLVAGDVQRVAQAPVANEGAMAPRIQASAGADVVQERGFFEYHLYEIGRDVTLRNGQSKQIEFTTAPSVPVTKTYVLDLAPQYWGHTVTDPGHGAGSQDNAQVHIEFINDQDGGLGIPLPGGTVRLYKEDADGAVEFVGEDTVGHTPSEAKLSLHVGDAFDITGERLQVDFNQLGKRSIEETIQVSIRNHKDTEVVVKVVEDLFRARDAEIVESSQKYVLTDAHTAEFSLSIEAGGEAEIEYTVRYEW